jgi:hypothetical protein
MCYGLSKIRPSARELAWRSSAAIEGLTTDGEVKENAGKNAITRVNGVCQRVPRRDRPDALAGRR